MPLYAVLKPLTNCILCFVTYRLAEILDDSRIENLNKIDLVVQFNTAANGT